MFNIIIILFIVFVCFQNDIVYWWCQSMCIEMRLVWQSSAKIHLALALVLVLASDNIYAFSNIQLFNGRQSVQQE